MNQKLMDEISICYRSAVGRPTLDSMEIGMLIVMATYVEKLHTRIVKLEKKVDLLNGNNVVPNQ